ncbi:MAG: mechanosensitive ion channel family protein [Lewinellaceae bacterium]|nr:mechanosensitive ion channel family protein [Lewinellaceae bacterium]
MEQYTQQAQAFIIEKVPTLLAALLLLLVGFWIIKKLSHVLEASLKRSSFEPGMVSFLVSLASIIAKALLILSVAGMVGINTAAFVGMLAAAGLAIGLALQGSLGNFAAGIIIVVFKPYKVGDWVEVKEKFGKIEDIQIFNTIVSTPGNKTLIIPNGEVINGIITNFSKKGSIRIELTIHMPFSEDFPRLRELIFKELELIPKVLKDPAPEIGISSFESHYLEISVRPYVIPDDYWEVYHEALARIKHLYHTNNIKVAYSEGIELGSVGE